MYAGEFGSFRATATIMINHEQTTSGGQEQRFRVVVFSNHCRDVLDYFRCVLELAPALLRQVGFVAQSGCQNSGDSVPAPPLMQWVHKSSSPREYESYGKDTRLDRHVRVGISNLGLALRCPLPTPTAITREGHCHLVLFSWPRRLDRNHQLNRSGTMKRGTARLVEKS
jgi:hypothetical protein